MAQRGSQRLSGTISDRLRAGINGVDPLASPRTDDAIPTTSYPHVGYQAGTAWVEYDWVSPRWERNEQH